MTKGDFAADHSAWLSVQSAADELEVTPRTIYRFINDGKLAAYRIGRVYRIKRTDLNGFLVAAAVKPGDLDHLVEPGRTLYGGTRRNGDGGPAGVDPPG